MAGTLVLWYHLSWSSRVPWVKASGSLGWCGVQIFFVVSGFIIPFAMARSGYRYPRDLGRFMARRLIRLDPPYLVASAAAAALAYAAWKTPGFAGPPPSISWANTLAHIGYLNGILGMPWYDVVCWTLGVEFQFYLFMALAFPLVLTRRSRLFALAAVTGLGASIALHRLGFIAGAHTGAPLLLTWLPYFTLGIAGFRLLSGFDSRAVFGVVAAAATTVAVLTGPIVGVVAAVVATGTLLTTRLVLPNVLAAYAALTYSLYLVHVPIGERAVRLIQRCGIGSTVEACALLAGVVSSLLAAYVLFRFVERPAMAFASRFAMTGPPSHPADAGPRASGMTSGAMTTP